MAVDSKPFGPVVLTDGDAVQFKKQVDQGPSKAARALYKRADALRFNDNTGETVLKPRKIVPARELVKVG